jgi:hypothetical protein
MQSRIGFSGSVESSTLNDNEQRLSSVFQTMRAPGLITRDATNLLLLGVDEQGTITKTNAVLGGGTLGPTSAAGIQGPTGSVGPTGSSSGIAGVTGPTVLVQVVLVSIQLV